MDGEHVSMSCEQHIGSSHSKIRRLHCMKYIAIRFTRTLLCEIVAYERTL